MKQASEAVILALLEAHPEAIKEKDNVRRHRRLFGLAPRELLGADARGVGFVSPLKNVRLHRRDADTPHA